MSPSAHFTAIPVAEKRRRKASSFRYTVPPVGVLDEPVVIQDFMRDLMFVRLRRKVTDSAGEFMGVKLIIIEEWYLDGTYMKRAVTEDGKNEIVNDREIMATDRMLRAARTKDVIDFGRFQEAAIALMATADDAKDDPTQEEVVMRGYQGMLAWREQLRQEVLAVDATLDLVAAKVRGMIQ